MKKTFQSLLILALTSLVCASCSLIDIKSFFPYTNYVEDSNPFVEITKDGYYRPASYTSLSYYDYLGRASTVDNYHDVFQDKYNGSSRKNALRTDLTNGTTSVNSQKMLVIPVDFSDYPASTLPERNPNASLTNIRNAFFGDPSVTQWESVASFYNKSSYGKMRITGTVSNWFRYSKTAEEIKNDSRSSVKNIAADAVQWYQRNYGNISSFDQDGDGKIDALYLIYSRPYVPKRENNSSIFWAYTSYITTSFNIGCFAWTSYSFLNVSKHSYTDARTLIHESGHLLGLPDYYNTIGLPSGPTGKVDMMDYSIGDHTVLSKMLLNWTRPYVVTDKTTINLKPFEENGDFILIPCGTWNGSIFDEYLLLEFYSPTKLNMLGANSNLVYEDDTGGHHTLKLMSAPGIKVYHVDARLAYFNVTTIGTETFLSLLENTTTLTAGSHLINLAYNNDSSSHPLYHLLEASGNETFIASGNVATNETLFREGDSFGYETFKNFTFYRNNTKLPFKFKVVEVTNHSATIDFEIN